MIIEWEVREYIKRNVNLILLETGPYRSIKYEEELLWIRTLDHFKEDTSEWWTSNYYDELADIFDIEFSNLVEKKRVI